MYGHGQDFGMYADVAGTGNGTGVKGVGAGVGGGVLGIGGAINGIGVEGRGGGGPSAGVPGVGGSANGNGVVGFGVGTAGGVSGLGGASNGPGVTGTGGGGGDGVRGTAATGNGLHGRATAARGVGVRAESTAGGTALQVAGIAAFSRSGILTVAAGKSSGTVTGVALTPASLVLATLQQNLPGVYVRSAVPNVAGSSFTVHLSKTVTASAKVAWFVVN